MIESILSCKIADFVVNTAVNSVNAAPIAGVYAPLREPYGFARFQAQDNILIKSAAVTLPYCFTLADERAAVTFTYRKISNGARFSISELAQQGNLWLFSENVETELNTYWQWKANISTETHTYFEASMQFHLNKNDAIPASGLINISMVNCPASLHGLTMPIFCFLKVMHTLPLTAIP